MGSINTAIQLYDGASAALQKITNAVSQTTQRFDDMNDHFDDAFNESGFNSAKNGFNTINILINKMENNIDRSTTNQQAFAQQVNKSTAAEEQMLSHMKSIDDAVNNLNNSVKQTNTQVGKTADGFKGWQKAIIVANQAINLIKSTLGSIGVFDMSNAFNRIDTMNRFKKTITIMTGDSNLATAALAQLKDTVLGTAYGLDVASKSTQGFMTRGMSLGAATNQVRVWADAVSFYGEGTNEQLESVVDAIGKMFSKGTVEADQLDRLFDAGIGAAEIYAKAVNRNVSDVKDDLSKGAISSANFINVVSQALDAGVSAGAAKDAGNTWATTFSNMRAAITRGWTDVITDLDTALASRGLPSSMEMVKAFGVGVEAVLGRLGDAMGYIVDKAIPVYNILSNIAGFFSSNWTIIKPAILGVVGAVAAYNIALTANNVKQGISNFLKGVAEVQNFSQAKAVMANKMAHDAEAISTAKATIAQSSFNTALYACPLTWIIVIIIALIAIFYIVIAVINKLKGTSYSATGMIVGAFMWLAAMIGNIVIGAINSIIQYLWTNFVEPWIGIVEWVLNVFNGGFNSFGDAVKNLLGQIISWFLSLGKVVTKIIDAIFGTNWTDGLNALQNKVLSWGKNENSITISRDAPEIDKRFDLSEAYNLGYNLGDKAFDSLGNLLETKEEEVPIDYNDLVNNTELTADNTGKMAKAVKISDEDLKFLHDVAEREAINRFTTAEIKVDMTNNNSINGTRDIDGIVDYLKNEVEAAMSRSAEGV